jgi:hypothetical protein
MGHGALVAHPAQDGLLAFDMSFKRREPELESPDPEGERSNGD